MAQGCAPLARHANLAKGMSHPFDKDRFDHGRGHQLARVAEVHETTTFRHAMFSKRVGFLSAAGHSGLDDWPTLHLQMNQIEAAGAGGREWSVGARL